MFVSVCDGLDPDVLCFLCLQPAVDYRGLVVTGMRRVTVTQATDMYRVEGLCYKEGCLFVVDGGRQWSDGIGTDSFSLTVYRVEPDSGDITHLDTLTVWEKSYPWTMRPRVDHHAHRVFIPCFREKGVIVACLDGDRLVRERSLTCVKDPISVDVMTPDTVYVGDRDSKRVHVVDIRDDRITATLDKPDTVSQWDSPQCLAVLGDSVMVYYFDMETILVVYRHGSPTPVKVIPPPGGLKWPRAINTDFYSNYMVTYDDAKSVIIIDSNGDVRHKLNIPDTDSKPRDCAVVIRQLWVACDNGDIVIMSSQ